VGGCTRPVRCAASWSTSIPPPAGSERGRLAGAFREPCAKTWADRGPLVDLYQSSHMLVQRLVPFDLALASHFVLFVGAWWAV
jgi:hypothetical protein